MALTGYCISDNNKSVKHTPTHPPTDTVLYQPSQEGLIIVSHCLAFSKTDLGVRVCDRWKPREGTLCHTPHKISFNKPPSSQAGIHMRNICSIFLMTVSHHLMSQSLCSVSRTSPNDDGKSRLNIKTEEPHAVE